MIASTFTYLLLILAAVLLALAQVAPVCKNLGISLDIIVAAMLIVDYQLTVRPKLLSASRETNERLSIGRSNAVELKIYNESAIPVKCVIRDDFPNGIDADAAEFKFKLPASSMNVVNYKLTPRRRGLYQFGNINIRYSSRLGMFWRQTTIEAKKSVKVYSDLKTLYELSVKLSRSSELGELHQRK